MSLKKRIIALFTAAVLAVSFAACSTADTSWAVQYKEDTMPAGLYLYYQLQAYADAYNQVENPEEEIFDQMVGDVTALDYINQQTDLSVRKYYAINDLFDELGLTLTEVDTTTTDTTVNTNWSSYQDIYEANGVSESSYRLAVENSYKSDLIFEYYYAPGGTEEVTEEEYLDVFANDYAKTLYIAIPLFDSLYQYYDADTMQTLRDKAQEYADRANNGENFDSLIEEFDAYRTELDQQHVTDTFDEALGSQSSSSSESSESSAPEADNAPAVPATGSDLPATGSDLSGSVDFAAQDSNYISVIRKDATDYPQSFIDALFAMGYNHAEVIECTDADYILVTVRMDMTQDEALMENYKKNARLYLKSDEFTQMLDERAETIEVTENEAAMNKYSPKNIRLQIS